LGVQQSLLSMSRLVTRLCDSQCTPAPSSVTATASHGKSFYNEETDRESCNRFRPAATEVSPPEKSATSHMCRTLVRGVVQAPAMCLDAAHPRAALAAILRTCCTWRDKKSTGLVSALLVLVPRLRLLLRCMLPPLWGGPGPGSAVHATAAHGPRSRGVHGRRLRRRTGMIMMWHCVQARVGEGSGMHVRVGLLPTSSMHVSHGFMHECPVGVGLRWVECGTSRIRHACAIGQVLVVLHTSICSTMHAWSCGVGNPCKTGTHGACLIEVCSAEPCRDPPLTYMCPTHASDTACMELRGPAAPCNEGNQSKHAAGGEVQVEAGVAMLSQPRRRPALISHVTTEGTRESWVPGRSI
jgi:hypothetical protein